MEKQCPHCDAIITQVNTSQNVREYGTMDITSRGFDNYDCNDSSYDDEPEYECPECNELVTYDDLLDIADDDDNDDDVDDDTRIQQSKDKWTIQ